MMIAFDVYLNGRKIDTVYFNEKCGVDYVRDCLVNHDGFHCGIIAVPARKEGKRK
jgi:hypothetical protein